MKQNSSSRYARALFDQSISEDKIDVVFNNIEFIFNTLELKSDLFKLTNNPTISKDLKIQVFNKVFNSRVDRLTMKFLNLVINRSRESILHQITKNFIDLYHQHKGVVTATVTSAKALTESDRLAIFSKVNPNGKVKIKELIDPSLLGGLIINTGGKEYNTSVKKQIINIKKVFEL